MPNPTKSVNTDIKTSSAPPLDIKTGSTFPVDIKTGSATPVDTKTGSTPFPLVHNQTEESSPDKKVLLKILFI